MPTARRVEKMTRVLKNRQQDLTIVCENIHDPHNVSAILRTCDSVGIDTVNLLYNVNTYPKMGKRSSASARKWIKTEKFNKGVDLRAALKQQNFMIYATRMDGDNTKSIYDIDWTLPSAVILGNEHLGVSQDAFSIADESIYIPMFGMIESLNVSVAAAVILYEACRQRQEKNLYPNPAIDEKTLQETLAIWKEK